MRHFCCAVRMTMRKNPAKAGTTTFVVPPSGGRTRSSGNYKPAEGRSIALFVSFELCMLLSLKQQLKME